MYKGVSCTRNITHHHHIAHIIVVIPDGFSQLAYAPCFSAHRVHRYMNRFMSRRRASVCSSTPEGRETIATTYGGSRKRGARMFTHCFVVTCAVSVVGTAFPYVPLPPGQELAR